MNAMPWIDLLKWMIENDNPTVYLVVKEDTPALDTKGIHLSRKDVARIIANLF